MQMRDRLATETAEEREARLQRTLASTLNLPKCELARGGYRTHAHSRLQGSGSPHIMACMALITVVCQSVCVSVRP